MNAIISKLNQLNNEQLKDAVAKLAADFRDGADVVFNAALEILESRLPEAEFVDFCDAI